MFHNTLYRLERNQKNWLTGLGFGFLILSVLWFAAEWNHWSFPFEPVVVFFGGIATLMATFWPWKPPYRDRRRSGRNVVDYSSNDGKFVIGDGEMTFTLDFYKSSDTNIQITNHPDDIGAIALVANAGRFDEVRDASVLDYTNRVLRPNEGEIVALRNRHGNYALVQIHDVRDVTRPPDDRDEVTFSYVINPDRGTDFG